MDKLELHHWLAIGGGLVVVIAVLVYFLAKPGLRVPATIGGAAGGIALGTAVGIAVMMAIGYTWTKPVAAQEGRAIPRAELPPLTKLTPEEAQRLIREAPSSQYTKEQIDEIVSKYKNMTDAEKSKTFGAGATNPGPVPYKPGKPPDKP